MVTLDYFRCWWDFLLPQAVERWDFSLRECKETWKELHGVPLLPLASGAAGTFGTSRAVGGGKGYMLATRRQQGLIPQLKGTFVHLKATRRLKQFFECDAFLQVRSWCRCWRHARCAGFDYQCRYGSPQNLLGYWKHGSAIVLCRMVHHRVMDTLRKLFAPARPYVASGKTVLCPERKVIILVCHCHCIFTPVRS